ncbi:MAG: hypothetical protein ACE5JN_08040 [Candidatus Methylomirabilia bacterium]
MSRVESALRSRAAPTPVRPTLPRQLIVPAVIGLLVVIVTASTSAWQLLGAGRGLVPPRYYHVSGFIIVLATTVGQAVGWAGGSGVAYYVMMLVGFPRGFASWKLAMSVVYLGLGALPLLVYHVLFGRMSREGLEEWLSGGYPDAYWLLISGHRWVDWSLVPLGVIFLGVLWFTGESPRRSGAAQTLLALALLGTSLAVALSLAIHSPPAHLKIS